MGERVLSRFASLAVAFCVFVVVIGSLAMAPTASADSLPNGYDVTCTPKGSSQADCLVSGCPRVQGDEAGDVVHVRFNAQPQQEVGAGCNSTVDVTTSLVDETVDVASGFTFSIQGCRKHMSSSDDCGAWSTYTYTPPPRAAAPAPVVSNEGDPIRCTACTKPADAVPAAIPDVTNAIQASFGQPGLTSVDFSVNNTSNLDATCHYTATANTLNPLVPKKTTRQFNVPANGTIVETFNGAPTLTTYNATLSCSDASGKQQAEMGHVVTSVLW